MGSENSKTVQRGPIAKASIRRRLWRKLGLGPFDGTTFRDASAEGDVIVLSLRHSIVADYSHVTSFEGFPVEVRAVTTAQAYQV